MYFMQRFAVICLRPSTKQIKNLKLILSIILDYFVLSYCLCRLAVSWPTCLANRPFDFPEYSPSICDHAYNQQYVFTWFIVLNRFAWICEHLYNIIYSPSITYAMAFQITGVTNVCSTVCPSANEMRHQSFAALAFVSGIHRLMVDSPHKWPVTRKMGSMLSWLNCD